MRIYITSRNRTPSSASPSDFLFALERPIELPEGATGSIDSFTCSNTWEAVQKDVNQYLYFEYSYLTPGTLPPLKLTPGDLANAEDLAVKLTTGLAAAAPNEPPVFVTAVGNRLIFDCPGLGTGESFTVLSRQSLNSGVLWPLVTRPAGGVGRCMRFGWGDDKGHSVYTSSAGPAPHCFPSERPPHKPDGQP